MYSTKKDYKSQPVEFLKRQDPTIHEKCIFVDVFTEAESGSGIASKYEKTQQTKKILSNIGRMVRQMATLWVHELSHRRRKRAAESGATFT